MHTDIGADRSNQKNQTRAGLQLLHAWFKMFLISSYAVKRLESSTVALYAFLQQFI